MRVWVTGFVTDEGGHRGYTYDATKREAMHHLRRELLRWKDLDEDDQEGLMDHTGFFIDKGCELDSVRNAQLPFPAEPLSQKHGSLGQFIGYIDCPGLGEVGLSYVATFGAHADNGLA